MHTHRYDARISPVSSTRDLPLNIKHRFLPQVNNRNYAILRDMYNSENKYSSIWSRRFQSTLSPRLPDPRQRSYSPYERGSQSRLDFSSRISDSPHLNQQSPNKSIDYSRVPRHLNDSPAFYAKTNVKRVSYDPINGIEKKFNPNTSVLRSLGRGGPDYFSN